jgi:DNA-directed RNA polymerase specialized sigma24 family protein
MAGRELIRELHEASYRRLVIELLAHVDQLRAAEDAARHAFAAAYRDSRAVETAASPQEELTRSALEAVGRRERRAQLLAALQRRPRGSGGQRRFDIRLSDDAGATLAAFTALPPAQRKAAVLRRLAGLPDDEVAAHVHTSRATVQALLADADTAFRTTLDGDVRLRRRRIDDLAIELRQAIGMPPFDQIVATAARQRRRLVAAVAAAAVLVGGGAFASVGLSPSHQRSTPAANLGSAAEGTLDAAHKTAAVRRALHSPGTTMYAVARNASGVWASFWYCRSCAIERSFALLSRDGFQHARVVPLSTDGQGDAWAAPTGVFVVSSGLIGPVQVVTPYGAVSTVRGVSLKPPQPSGPDEIVVTSYGVGPPDVPIVVDGETLRKWPLTVPRFGDRGTVDLVQSYRDGFDLWGLHLAGPHRAPGIVHSADGGRTWSNFRLPRGVGGASARAISPVGPPLVSASGVIGVIGLLSLPSAGRGAELVASADGGKTWRRSGPLLDHAGRPIAVSDATLTASGALLVSGRDARGIARVWRSQRTADGHSSPRPVLRESVTFARPPLDDPTAIWATAPQAIWQSTDGGRMWDLLVSHHAWQGVKIVG